mmetsp:Transcript_33769/g.95548  ORF Transcript_33769/g.95548 Transcript_33769/m.95548 type:complete len:251 (+) Transcript_33769:844-1596(+)
MVDLDLAAVHLDPKLLKAEPLGVRAAASGHQHNIRLHLLRVTARCGLHRDLHLAAGQHLGARDLSLCLECHPLLLQLPLEGLADIPVHWGDNLVHELDNSDLRPQAAPHGGHLQADDAAADYNHLLGNLLQGDGSCGGDNFLLVNRGSWQRGDLRAGGNDDVLGRDDRGGAIFSSDLHLRGALQLAPALGICHLVLLEQAFNALCEAGDSRLLLLHHLVEVDLNVRHYDSVVSKVLCCLGVHVARMEQSL